MTYKTGYKIAVIVLIIATINTVRLQTQNSELCDINKEQYNTSQTQHKLLKDQSKLLIDCKNKLFDYRKRLDEYSLQKFDARTGELIKEN